MADARIDARFTPGEVLSEGALTRVLAARDLDGAPVILKRLQRHLLWDRQCVAMLDHEARLHDALRGPGIAPLLTHGVDADGPWVALARVPGETLAARVPADPVGVARALLAVLARVHAAAHEGLALRVVHRDVCPANVLVGPAGEVTLLDFGIATSRWREDPDRGVLKGTRGYMAPEVVTGDHEVTPATDLFAVGVILTEMLAGQRLYAGVPMRVLGDIAEGPVRGPRDLGAAVSPALDAAVRVALAKSPTARYPDAAAFREALTRCDDASHRA
ncbi:MAG: serine/threonine-protein kinase [Polyangiales bacterium]